MGKVGDDRLPAVARVVPDEVVVQTPLAAQVVDGAGLVKIEVRGGAW